MAIALVLFVVGVIIINTRKWGIEGIKFIFDSFYGLRNEEGVHSIHLLPLSQDMRESPFPLPRWPDASLGVGATMMTKP